MNRWSVLALLFAARTVMAMQYQVIGALSPQLGARFAVGLTEIGVLIGCYVVPGLVFALPGSAIGQRLGEKPVVVVACGLMAAGAALMALTEAWGVFLAGHLLAGVGGVLINILMTKMVADWFFGAEITTALAIFINSWPVGIGISLVVFPPLAAAFGVISAFWCLSLLALIMGALIAFFYHAPPGSLVGDGPRVSPRGAVLYAVVYAGICWGAFNGGLAVLFGLGTPLLVSFGETPEAAARSTSLILWVIALAAPLGGIWADRSGRGCEMIAGGLVCLAILSPLVLREGLTVPVFLLFGAVSGLVAGPIVSLPARVLGPDMRMVGMGVFFTIYYAIFIAAPVIAGGLADATGTIAAAFWCAAILQVAALSGLILYVRADRQAKRIAEVRE